MENINTNPETPVQSFTTPTPSTPQNNIYKSLFFIFFALFLIVTSVSITLLITKNKNQPSIKNSETSENLYTSPTAIPTIDPTADWKTYVNLETKYSLPKFSIKYPNDWIIDTSAIDSVRWTTTDYQKKYAEVKDLNTPGPILCGSYLIMCFKNVDDYIQFTSITNVKSNSLLEYLTSNNSKFADLEKSTINNANVYSFNESSRDDRIKTYILEREDKLFCNLSFCNKDLTETENQFLNSFKFTN